MLSPCSYFPHQALKPVIFADGFPVFPINFPAAHP
jgi:hypothetical protein